MCFGSNGLLLSFLEHRGLEISPKRVLKRQIKANINFIHKGHKCLRCKVLQEIRYLFHEHINVSLGSIQYITVRMCQTFHCYVHCFAINVDPTWSTTRQKGPDQIRVKMTGLNANVISLINV